MAIGEEMGSDGFLPKGIATAPGAPANEPTTPVTPPEGSVQPPVVTPTTVEPPAQPPVTTQVDEFIDKFNQRYSSTFKTDDGIRGILGSPQKIAEYEAKLKDFDSFKTKNEELLRINEEIKNNTYSDIFSKPRMRSAYIVDQLVNKYPDKDPDALQEIVMADLDKMGDLDLLVKAQKLDLPKFSEADIKNVLLEKYGIDADTKPEEWSSTAKLKIAMDAQRARTDLKNISQGIEVPKVVTKEERERMQNEALQKRLKDVEPLKAKFLQFDKFKNGDFEYETSAEDRSKLPDMFQAMFIDAGLEPTPENEAAITELRDALFVLHNFPKLMDVAGKKYAVEVQRKLDEALSNTTPPNTAQAPPPKTEKQLPGKSLSEGIKEVFG